MELYGTSNFTVRALKTTGADYTSYKLISNRNKTFAEVINMNGTLMLTVYSRLLPDEHLYIKPPYAVVASDNAPITDDGIDQIARTILQTLDTPNDYSNDTVKKIDVSLSNASANLVGGVVAEMTDMGDNTTLVVLESGIGYVFPTTIVIEKHLVTSKFIIVDSDLKFEVLFRSEIGQYFNLKEC